MLKSYFKIAYQNFLKYKIYSSINILGFAIGLAAFILMALYVQYELSYDTYHEKGDRIYRVVRNKPSGESGEPVKTAVTPTPLAPLLRNELPEIVSATRIIKTTNVLITYQKNYYLEEKVHWSDTETFDMFTIPFLTGNPETALNDPYSILLSESAAKKYFGNEKKMVTLFSAFAVLATIVACLGLFGLATFAAERRMKEISVRKVLGASAPDIFVLLSKEFLRWVALANIIAWPVAYYFTRQWLNDFAYRVDIVWWMFAFPGAIALLIALATVSGQAIKSAYRNPVESLRDE